MPGVIIHTAGPSAPASTAEITDNIELAVETVPSGTATTEPPKDKPHPTSLPKSAKAVK